MALRSWPAKRIMRFWVGGLILQALLLVIPILLAHQFARSGSEMLRVFAEQQERRRAVDLADSLSLVGQRQTARESHSYTVNAKGDTLFPLVSVPSGASHRVSVVTDEDRRRNAMYFMAFQFGLVPALLVLLTVSWKVARRDPKTFSPHMT